MRQQQYTHTIFFQSYVKSLVGSSHISMGHGPSGYPVEYHIGPIYVEQEVAIIMGSLVKYVFSRRCEVNLTNI